MSYDVYPLSFSHHILNSERVLESSRLNTSLRRNPEYKHIHVEGGWLARIIKLTTPFFYFLMSFYIFLNTLVVFSPSYVLHLNFNSMCNFIHLEHINKCIKERKILKTHLPIHI